ncbi:MAG: transposase, partial [Pseudomonadota bacterium]
MSELNLYSPLFHDKEKAREFIEELLWPNGEVCAHCKESDRIYELKGKSTPNGSYKCGHCRKRFTVTLPPSSSATCGINVSRILARGSLVE